MKKYAMGLEHELAIVYKTPKGWVSKDEPVFNVQTGTVEQMGTAEILRNELLNLVLDNRRFAPKLPRKWGFFWNGGKSYIAMNIFELATPECDDPYSLARYEKAMEAIVYDKLKEFNSRLRTGKIYPEIVEKIDISKKSSDIFHHGFGTHENHQIKSNPQHRKEGADRLEATRKQYSHPLKEFFVSRIPLVGCGNLDSFGFFAVSPRALVTSGSIGRGAVLSGGTKNMAFIRNDPSEFDVANDYARLQICCSDGNISSYQTELKTGTTAIVLRMIEDGFLEKPPVELESCTPAFRTTSLDTTLCKPLRTKNGSTITALQLNLEYLKKALEYFRIYKMSSWEARLMKQWEAALSSLFRNPARLDTFLDWRILHRLTKEFLAEYHNLDLSELQENLKSEDPALKEAAGKILTAIQVLFLKYFFIGDAGLRSRLFETGRMDNSLLRHEEMTQNSECFLPPPGMRGEGRYAILKGLERKREMHRVKSVHWGTIEIVNPDGNCMRLINSDPNSTEFLP